MADDEKPIFKGTKLPTENSAYGYDELSGVFTDEYTQADYFEKMIQEGNNPGLKTSVINSFRGFNPFGRGPSMMPISDTIIGLMFITKPACNLHDNNILKSEKLLSLYGTGTGDLGGYIRGTLDPKWARLNLGDDSHPMVDTRNPFISCLNEYLKTSTGFSDMTMKFDTTDPGLRQQVYQFAASKLEENGLYTMQQTYHNPKPLIIQTIFQHWLTYISEVKSGDNGLQPYLEYDITHRNDHDCRIYHLIMNKDTQYLESLYATVSSIPSSYPAGALADIDRTQNTLRANGQDEFTQQFSCTGMRFDELSLIRAFNEHTYYFNNDLYQEIKNNVFTNWRIVQPSEYNEYKYNVYPLLLATQRDVGLAGYKQKIRQGIKLTWWTRKR